MFKKIVLIIVVILFFGAFVPKFFLKDKVTSLSEGSQCPKNEVRLFLDNPLEKIMLMFGGLQTLSKEGESNYIVRAYTVFGIPFTKVKVEECYGGVQRL